MMEIEPATRVEHFLSAASDGSRKVPEPVTRVEFLLAKLVDTLNEIRSSGGGSAPSSGLPRDFADELLATLRQQAFATPNGASLVDHIEQIIVGGDK